MSNKKTVRAAPGKVVFFPTSVAAAPGARPMSITGATTLLVDCNNRFVRRRLQAGDLEIVNATKATTKKDKTK
jgi:hypothetical protein